MFKRIAGYFAAVTALSLAGFNSVFAAGLIDASAVSSAQTDILADIAVVAGVVITVCLAIVGFHWARRALGKGGA